MAKRKQQSNRPNSPRVVPAYQSDAYSRNSAAYRSKSGQRSQSEPQQAAGQNQYSRTNPAYSKRAKKSGRTKKVAIAVVLAVVLVLGGVGGAAALMLSGIDQSLAGNKTEAEMQEIQDALVPLVSFDKPFYMMLIGSDAREGSDEEGERSDTAILARVDAPNGIVTLLSIPRDTKITIDGYGTQKFNAAYAYNGAAGTIKEASQLCGVDISHYAEINFTKLIELVDVVGGVEVDVPEIIDDPDAGPVVIQPGLQTLDGEAALVFARSRAYADGDFTRTSNQRLLIEALMNKVLSLPATELPALVQRAAACVTTDLKATDFLSLASQLQGAASLTMYSAMVPSGVDMIGGVSYVLADTAGLAKMMKVIDTGGDPNTVVITPETTPSTDSATGSTSGYGSSGSYSGTDSGYDPNYDPNYGSGYSSGYDPDYDPNYDPDYDPDAAY